MGGEQLVGIVHETFREFRERGGLDVAGRDLAVLPDRSRALLYDLLQRRGVRLVTGTAPKDDNEQGTTLSGRAVDWLTGELVEVEGTYSHFGLQHGRIALFAIPYKNGPSGEIYGSVAPGSFMPDGDDRVDHVGLGTD